MPKKSAIVRRLPCSIGAVTGLVLVAIAAPAAAQRVPFERTYEVGANAVLDVSTVRGRIEVTGGETDRVTVAGTTTVRVGWNVPANAVEIEGTVKWFNPDKGFGFVVCEDGGKDVFLHISVVERAGLRGLNEGQQLAMKVVKTQKGREATEISLLE